MFRLQPLDPVLDFNPDGTEKFRMKSKLMLKLLKIKDKPENAHSEDELNNSYAEGVSDVSDEEEEDDEEEEERRKRAAKKKKKKKKKKATVLDALNKMQRMQMPPKKKKKPTVMNVYCTQYDVVKKCAKQFLGFKLKERPEDHDGAIRKGVGGQKLDDYYDITWHDLMISVDFFAKMQPY